MQNSQGFEPPPIAQCSKIDIKEEYPQTTNSTNISCDGLSKFEEELNITDVIQDPLANIKEEQLEDYHQFTRTQSFYAGRESTIDYNADVKEEDEVLKPEAVYLRMDDDDDSSFEESKCDEESPSNPFPTDTVVHKTSSNWKPPERSSTTIWQLPKRSTANWQPPGRSTSYRQPPERSTSLETSTQVLPKLNVLDANSLNQDLVTLPTTAYANTNVLNGSSLNWQPPESSNTKETSVPVLPKLDVLDVNSLKQDSATKSTAVYTNTNVLNGSSLNWQPPESSNTMETSIPVLPKLDVLDANSLKQDSATKSTAVYTNTNLLNGSLNWQPPESSNTRETCIPVLPNRNVINSFNQCPPTIPSTAYTNTNVLNGSSLNWQPPESSNTMEPSVPVLPNRNVVNANALNQYPPTIPTTAYANTNVLNGSSLNWQPPERSNTMETSLPVLPNRNVISANSLNQYPPTIPTAAYANTNVLNGSSLNWQPPERSNAMETSIPVLPNRNVISANSLNQYPPTIPATAYANTNVLNGSSLNWQPPERSNAMETSIPVLPNRNVINANSLNQDPAAMPITAYTNVFNGSSLNWGPQILSSPVLANTQMLAGTPVLVMTNISMFIGGPTPVLGNTGALNGTLTPVLGNTNFVKQTCPGFTNTGALNFMSSNLKTPIITNTNVFSGFSSSVFRNTDLLKENYAPDFANTGIHNGTSLYWETPPLLSTSVPTNTDVPKGIVTSAFTNTNVLNEPSNLVPPSISTPVVTSSGVSEKMPSNWIPPIASTPTLTNLTNGTTLPAITYAYVPKGIFAPVFTNTNVLNGPSSNWVPPSISTPIVTSSDMSEKTSNRIPLTTSTLINRPNITILPAFTKTDKSNGTVPPALTTTADLLIGTSSSVFTRTVELNGMTPSVLKSADVLIRSSLSSNVHTDLVNETSSNGEQSKISTPVQTNTHISKEISSNQMPPTILPLVETTTDVLNKTTPSVVTSTDLCTELFKSVVTNPDETKEANPLVPANRGDVLSDISSRDKDNIEGLSSPVLISSDTPEEISSNSKLAKSSTLKEIPSNSKPAKSSTLKTQDISSASTPVSCEPEMQVCKEAYNCDSCGEVFSSKNMFILHQNNSSFCKPDLTREVHSCKICNQLFLTNENLIRHQEFNLHCRPKSKISEASKEDSAPPSVEDNGEGSIFSRYTCHLCEKRFAHSSGLVRHHKLCHETLDDTFCEMCETTFKTKNLLKYHKCMRECDRSDFFARCQENVLKYHERDLSKERVLETDSTLKDHQLNTANKHKRLKFSCSVCDITLETELELQEHICDVDDPQLPHHICAVCKDTFDTKEELQKHKCCHFRTANQIVYFCKTCTKTFKTSEGLKKHQVVHPGGPKITRYICDYCDISYKSKQTLNIHQYNVHSKEKPFKCKICKMSFIVERNYWKHLDSIQHLLNIKNLTLNGNCSKKKILKVESSLL